MQIENFEKLNQLNNDYKLYQEVVKDYETWVSNAEPAIITIELLHIEDKDFKSVKKVDGSLTEATYKKGARFKTIGTKDPDMCKAVYQFMIDWYRNKVNSIKEEFESIKIK